MDLEFLTKSLPLQLAIGGGYIGYMTAYAGIRGHHQQTDVAFLTIAFGLVATLAAYLLAPLVPAYLPLNSLTFKIASQVQNGLVIVLSVLAAVATGIAWRTTGRNIVRWALRRGRVSFADDDPSVLTTIFADRDHNVSQVLVAMDDGTEFVCNDTSRFKDAAITPFILGADGSVGLYATHVYRRDKDGVQSEKVQTNVRNAKWGDNMTIVPAGKVQQIDIRLQRKR